MSPGTPPPAPHSFEERLLRVRLWTLPVVFFVPSIVWEMVARHGVLPSLPYGSVWAFVFLWWLYEAAPRPYSLRATFGRSPSLPEWGLMALLLWSAFCMHALSWMDPGTWAALQARQLPPSFVINLPQTPTWSGLLITVVVAPLLEELTWRGTIFRKWRARYGPGKALLVSSVLFGCLHPDKVGATLLGLTFVLLYTRARSLGAAVVLHSVHNAVACAMGAWGPIPIHLDSGWKLALFTLILLLGIGVWLRFALTGWRTLSDPLPPDSLQAHSLQPESVRPPAQLPEPLHVTD